MSLTGTDWLFSLGAALLAAAGVALLLWALWGDWLRGVLAHRRTGTRRRRCPKCWYDMARVQGLRCPECGREARRESRLRRSRRPRRLATIACALGALAWGASRGPAVRSRGWPAAAPTTALILLLPYMDAAAGRSAFPSPPRGGSVSERLVDELTHVRLSRRLPGWQRWLVLELCLPSELPSSQAQAWTTRDVALSACLERAPLTEAEWRRWIPLVLEKAYRSRASWPRGVAVYATPVSFGGMRNLGVIFRPPGSPGATATDGRPRERAYGWKDGAQCIGLPGDSSQSLICDAWGVQSTRMAHMFGPKEVPAGRFQLPIRIEGEIDDHMTRESLPDVDDALRCATAWMVTNGPPAGYVTLSVTIDGRTAGAVFDRIGQASATFAAHVELLRNGEPITSARSWWNSRPTSARSNQASAWEILSAWVSIPSDPRDEARWSLRIMPDQETALRDYASVRCWGGEGVEVFVHVASSPSGATP